MPVTAKLGPQLQTLEPSPKKASMLDNSEKKDSCMKAVSWVPLESVMEIQAALERFTKFYKEYAYLGRHSFWQLVMSAVSYASLVEL